MMRPTDAPPPPPGAHLTKGHKKNKKKMACVGCVYSVDRRVRTPEELVATLFRDADRPQLPPPVAQHKRNWASLTREVPHPTGVIEGACCHLIKDRWERTVIRWKIPGTQAMLDIHTNDDWELYQTFRMATFDMTHHSCRIQL